MKTLIALTVLTLTAGCVATPAAYYAPPVAFYAPPVAIEMAYEPEVIVSLYPMGFYNPTFGYWTGGGWDANFYVYGHPGYGHYYSGAPRAAFEHYQTSTFYRGGATAGVGGGTQLGVAANVHTAVRPSWGARFGTAVASANAKVQANARAGAGPTGATRTVVRNEGRNRR